MRAGERELHAGAKRRVHVEVALVGGSEDFVEAREHSRHARRRRWGRGQEAHAAAALLEGAVRARGLLAPGRRPTPYPARGRAPPSRPRATRRSRYAPERGDRGVPRGDRAGGGAGVAAGAASAAAACRFSML